MFKRGDVVQDNERKWIGVVESSSSLIAGLFGQWKGDVIWFEGESAPIGCSTGCSETDVTKIDGYEFEAALALGDTAKALELYRAEKKRMDGWQEHFQPLIDQYGAAEIAWIAGSIAAMDNMLRVQWEGLYGETNPERRTFYEQAEAARLAAEEAERQRQLLRPVEQSPGAAFAELSTLQVGHRYAVACVLYAQAKRRWHDRRWQVPEPPEDEPKKRQTHEVDRLDSMDAYITNVWDEQQALMKAELVYRANVLDDEQARQILAKGVNYFYARDAYFTMTDSELLPEFTNGYLGQPYSVTQPPISRLRDAEVMRQLFALLDPDSAISGKFELDDVQAILGILRAQLKRLKPKQ